MEIKIQRRSPISICTTISVNGEKISKKKISCFQNFVTSCGCFKMSRELECVKEVYSFNMFNSETYFNEELSNDIDRWGQRIQ